MSTTRSRTASLFGAIAIVSILSAACAAEPATDDSDSTAQPLSKPVCTALPYALQCKLLSKAYKTCLAQCERASGGLEVPTYIGCCAGFGALDTCIASNFTDCGDVEDLAHDIQRICAETPGDPNACLANAFKKVLNDLKAKLLADGEDARARLLCKLYNCDAPAVAPQNGISALYTQDPTCPVPALPAGSEYRKSVYTSTVETAIPEVHVGPDVIPIRDADGKQPPACGAPIELPTSVVGSSGPQLWNKCSADLTNDLEFMVSYQPRCSVAPASASASGKAVGVCIASGGRRATYASTPADMMTSAQIRVRRKSDPSRFKLVPINDPKAFAFETTTVTVRKNNDADRNKQTAQWRQTHSADSEWKIITDTARNVTVAFVGDSSKGPGVANSAVLQALCVANPP